MNPPPPPITPLRAGSLPLLRSLPARLSTRTQASHRAYPSTCPPARRPAGATARTPHRSGFARAAARARTDALPSQSRAGPQAYAQTQAPATRARTRTHTATGPRPVGPAGEARPGGRHSSRAPAHAHDARQHALRGETPPGAPSTPRVSTDLCDPDQSTRCDFRLPSEHSSSMSSRPLPASPRPLSASQTPPRAPSPTRADSHGRVRICNPPPLQAMAEW